MARLQSEAQFNQDLIAFSKAGDSAPQYRFSDNKSIAWHGKVYADSYSLTLSDTAPRLSVSLYGPAIRVGSTGGIVGGTFNGINASVWTDGQWATAWSIEDVSVDASFMFGAMVTADAKDDARMIRACLAGSDLFVLSAFADLARGDVGNDTLNGYDGNDSLYGGSGADVLDGGAGADSLIGGSGDDVYDVQDGADVVEELTNEGLDTVMALISYTLTANVETLILTGNASSSGTGNSLANAITGNSAANSLFGLGGNDTLSGGGGHDTLNGGAGNDTYMTDDSDTIVEEETGGIDTVVSLGSYSLLDDDFVENLILSGSDGINGTGNSLNNTITGNGAENLLDGLTGNDTLVGGLGNDTYIINGDDTIIEAVNGGTDTVEAMVSYTMASNLENLILKGAAASDGTGNSGNNTLTGNSAANVLDGGVGNDTLIGGAGDDTYLSDGGDTITEAADGGTDTVKTSVSYSLAANLENVILGGSGSINGTGNGLNNVITGNGAANVLNGGTGADTLIGGAGDDTYTTDGGDTITEAFNGGTDTVKSSASHSLDDNIENLILTGAVSVNGTGNRLYNVITGNTAANILDGGLGADTMIGGLGNDTYIVDRLDAITEAVNGGFDTIVSALSYSLVANVENLTLSGTENLNGTGNSLNNLITGNGATNILNGDTGADTLIGGAGDDTYVTDGGDMITEAVDEGTDTVQSSASHTLANNVENLVLSGSAAINGTGNSLNNVITGNVVANVLNGGLGADTLIGGYGNDTYIIDSADTIIETAIGGTDTVQVAQTYTLASNLENLTLTGTAAINGTGNAANNTLTGNSAANILDGGAGTDALIGGLGDDTYITDGGDTITEGLNGGTDTVNSSATYTLASHVENLTLTGAAGLGGTGNTLNNRITGNDGANLLDGSGGNDTLLGGAGADSLTGGLGIDQLTGGDGADVFVFKSATETANTLATADTITDFIQGQERINLSAIDASASISGNNAFVWLGTAEIGTSTSGDLRFQKYDNEGDGNDYTLVFADTDKDTASEFMIKLVGLYDLTANDFIL